MKGSSFFSQLLLMALATMMAGSVIYASVSSTEIPAVVAMDSMSVLNNDDSAFVHGFTSVERSIGDAVVKYDLTGQGITDNINSALSMAGDLVNWFVLVIAMFVSFTVNETVDAKNVFNVRFARWMNTYVPRGLRTIIMTTLMSMAYSWAYGIDGRVDILSLFIITPLATMASLSAGGNKIMRNVTSGLLKWEF